MCCVLLGCVFVLCQFCVVFHRFLICYAVSTDDVVVLCFALCCFDVLHSVVPCDFVLYCVISHVEKHTGEKNTNTSIHTNLMNAVSLMLRWQTQE